MKRDARVVVTKAVNRYDVLVTVPLVNPKLFYTTRPYSNDDSFICDIVGDEVVVENPCVGMRPYFIVKSDSTPDILAAARAVDLDEVENFRDQGGYLTESGKVVKWGRFLRGGAFDKLSENGKAYLDTMNIKAILDYRATDEIERNPDYSPAGAKYNHAPAMRALPIGPGGDARVLRSLEEDVELITCESDVEESLNNFRMLYKDLPFHNPAYFKLFETLDSESTVPLYQHCSAGKDRTGVGCALTLLALGVDINTAMGDYLLSATYREEANKVFFENLKDKVTNEFGAKFFHRIMSVEKSFLQSSFDKIFEMYPSINVFLKEEYQITPDRIEHWRNLHLV